jgi:hypothetical protein
MINKPWPRPAALAFAAMVDSLACGLWPGARPGTSLELNVHFIPETMVENASLEVLTTPPSVGYYSVAETSTPEPVGSMMCNGVVWDSTTSVNFTEIKVAQPVTLTVNDPAMLSGANNTTSSSHSKGITIAILVSLYWQWHIARSTPDKITY